MALFELLEAGGAVDVGGERLEAERAQEQRGRQLLHGVDEHQQRGGAEGWHQEGAGCTRLSAESAVSPSVRAGGIEVGREALEALEQDPARL